MKNYIIFLRGVNVGGHATIKMDNLKNALLEKQYHNVKSYINSGNLVLSTLQDKPILMESVSEIIQSKFNLTIGMIIKTKEELHSIIANDPFDKEKETDNAKKVVAMLSERIDPAKARIFKTEGKIVENYYINGDLLYIYYQLGAGTSKLTNNYIEKKLNVISTARNWNTILKMSEIAETM